jgi:hypothetical protein
MSDRVYERYVYIVKSWVTGYKRIYIHNEIMSDRVYEGYIYIMKSWVTGYMRV